MTKVRVESFTVSLDGFGAGSGQSLENPLGLRGPELHRWFVPTRTFQEKVLGKNDGATEGVDNEFAARGFEDVGAWILGRNMFGPIRGPWLNEDWKGWWGYTPTYHVPVFVLTHHARASIEMNGGTTFHFVTGGIHEALERAKAAAQGKDVRIGGGVATIRQYLLAKLIDEMHLAYSPVLLGTGEQLLRDIDLLSLGYTVTRHVTSPTAMHVVFSKTQ